MILQGIQHHLHLQAVLVLEIPANALDAGLNAIFGNLAPAGELDGAEAAPPASSADDFGGGAVKCTGELHAVEAGAGAGIKVEAHAHFLGGRVALQVIAQGGAEKSVGAQPLLQVFEGLHHLRFGERGAQLQFRSGKELVTVGRIGNAFDADAAHKVIELRGNAQGDAVSRGFGVDRDIGIAPCRIKLFKGLMDVHLAQRASGVQRQQAVEFVAGERLRGGVKVDARDGAAFENCGAARGRGILCRRRYGAEQQRQEHQYRRTHVLQ